MPSLGCGSISHKLTHLRAEQRNLALQSWLQALGKHLVRFRRATVSRSESVGPPSWTDFNGRADFPGPNPLEVYDWAFVFPHQLDGEKFYSQKSLVKFLFIANTQGALCEKISKWGHTCYESGVLPDHQVAWEWCCQPPATECVRTYGLLSI